MNKNRVIWIDVVNVALLVTLITLSVLLIDTTFKQQDQIKELQQTQKQAENFVDMLIKLQNQTNYKIPESVEKVIIVKNSKGEKNE